MVPTMFSRLLKLPEDVRARPTSRRSRSSSTPPRRARSRSRRQMIEWLGPDHRRVLRRHRGATASRSATPSEWLAHKGTVGKRDPRRAAHPRRGRQRVPDAARPAPCGSAGATALRVLQRPGEDGGVAATTTATHEHGRRRRLRRRGRLPLPHRPQDVHDHLGRREHLPAGDREPPHHPPEGDRRGRLRRARTRISARR